MSLLQWDYYSIDYFTDVLLKKEHYNTTGNTVDPATLLYTSFINQWSTTVLFLFHRYENNTVIQTFKVYLVE